MTIPMQRKPLCRQLFAAVSGLALSWPLALQAASNDVVLLWGSQSDGEMMMDFEGFGEGAKNVTPRAACQMARSFLDANLPMPPAEFNDTVARLAGAMGGMDGAAAAAGALTDLDACAGDPDLGSSGNFYLIFTSCSMIMGSGTQWLRWTVPPLAEVASMIALDAATGTGVDLPLGTRMKQPDAVKPTGELIDYAISGPAGQKTFSLGVPQPREFAAYKYDFDYSGSLSMMPAGISADFMPKISIKAKGHSWVIPGAPGADVIATFYSNFRDHVAPAAGMASLMTAMVRQMADIATHGIPVETVQTSSVGGSGLAAAFDSSSTSTSTVKSLAFLPRKASGQCARTVIPQGIEITDMNQMMADATGSGDDMPGGPGMSAEQAASMSEAMSAMQGAMEQMTPEQREMMSKMGISLPGQPTAANPAGAGPSAGAAGSTRRSSGQLTTDNLTETVQLHLDALGYEVGRTDGTATLDTTIAISQFQAEKGLKVTGEVTPQLIGILAAEVDSR